MTHHKDRWLIGLLATIIVLSILQITLGGVVRVTGAGDACPDWPTCFGSLIPPLDDWQVVLEWGHRTVGVLLGLISIVATIYAVVRTFLVKERSWTVAIFTATNLILITITGVIGGTVVLSELNPILRTIHLLIAQFVVLSAAIALIIEAKPRVMELNPSTIKIGRILSVITMIAILAIIISGSYAVWRGAGLVCPSWPICNFSDGALPNSELEWINIAHRIVTGAATLIILYGAHFIMRRSNGTVKFAAITTLTTIIAAILLGAAVASTIRVVTENTDLLWLLNTLRSAHIGISSSVWGAACLMGFGWILGYSQKRANRGRVET